MGKPTRLQISVLLLLLRLLTSTTIANTHMVDFFCLFRLSHLIFFLLLPDLASKKKSLLRKLDLNFCFKIFLRYIYLSLIGKQRNRPKKTAFFFNYKRQKIFFSVV